MSDLLQQVELLKERKLTEPNVLTGKPEQNSTDFHEKNVRNINTAHADVKVCKDFWCLQLHSKLSLWLAYVLSNQDRRNSTIQSQFYI